MATTKLWTIEELEREGAPEGRWELIDGELVELTASGGRASKIAIRLALRIEQHADPRGLGEIYGADGGFVLFPGRDILRVADVAFVRTERLPSEEDQIGFLRLAPDLVVEVVSPYDRPGEIEAKTAMWLEAGVRLIWVVDPDARTVAVHAPNRPVVLLGEGDDLDGEHVVPGFRVAVVDLFP
jgi:Uma2 family endonuclease